MRHSVRPRAQLRMGLHRLIALAIGLGLLGALISACGSEDESGAGRSPGFNGIEEGSNDGTFELAIPSTGPTATTIPGFDANSLLSGTDPPVPTSPPAAPTAPAGRPGEPTTTVERNLFLPPTQSIVSICGLSRSLASVFPDQIDPAEVSSRLNRLVDSMPIYERVAPPEVRPDVTRLRLLMDELAGLLQQGGGDVDYPPLQEALGRLRALEPPYELAATSVLNISAYESSSC